MFELEVTTEKREQLVDLTAEVERAVTEAQIAEGLCHVYVPHTTCGVIVNEGHDPAVGEDLLRHLAELVPDKARWRHAEGNADAHVKSVMTGTEVTLPVQGGRLRLGRWQALFLLEFDGPRRRRVWVTVR